MTQPMPNEEYLVAVMTVPWYAVRETLIGGWAVSTVDLETHHGQGIEIADFMNEDVAQHMAALHNAWLLDVEALAQERKS